MIFQEANDETSNKTFKTNNRRGASLHFKRTEIGPRACQSRRNRRDKQRSKGQVNGTDINAFLQNQTNWLPRQSIWRHYAIMAR